MSASIFSHVTSYLRWITGSQECENPPASSNAATSNETLPECRFPLGNASSATMTLPDQRKLGYAEYGSPTGRPIFFLHGWPGSRVEAAFYDRSARKLDARIIAVDRPGFGWSSPQPDRKLLDHPKDLAQLAEHLGLEEYAVLGISGGGPYALACAAALPADRLRGVASVVGLGPPDIGYRGMALPNYLGWTYGFRLVPRLCRSWLSWQTMARLDLSQTRRLELLRREHDAAAGARHPVEADLFRDDAFTADALALCVQVGQQAHAQGPAGPMLDARLMAQPWDFAVEDVRADLPLFLWYGRFDTNVPANHGVQIAARFKGEAHLEVMDETHWTMGVKYTDLVLEKLLECF